MGFRTFLTRFRKEKEKEKEKERSPVEKGVLLLERRKHPRFALELPLNYSVANEKENRGGTTGDGSEGGLLVYLHEKVPIGTLLRVEILFARGTELDSIEAITKVVWTDLAARQGWGEYRYGLEFQSFREGGFEKLSALLKSAAKTAVTQP